MRAAGAATYGPQGRGRERRKDSAEIECYRCRKMGHVARNCPSAYEERRRDRRSDAPCRGGQRDSMAAATGGEQQRGATDRWERWARPDRSASDQERPCPWSAYREAADDGDEDYYEDHSVSKGFTSLRRGCWTVYSTTKDRCTSPEPPDRTHACSRWRYITHSPDPCCRG
uniref:CCHC-type domain-containing protein n=1 Tax=Knipowitschia caucasica TaxID=637954 RepID=A0AAV2LLF1_KNICA